MIDTHKLPRPRLPQFHSFEEERQHRKQKLAAIFRLFGKLGFEQGKVGQCDTFKARTL